MKALAQILNASVAWGIALMGAAVLLTTAHTAHAGINVWTSHGPPGGDVRALAIDPSTPSTLYAGTGRGGVFKSTDAGATWGAVGLPGEDVGALAIDPSTPSTLYAVPYRGSVAKSTDAGATWRGALLPYYYVHALAIDPNTLSTLYAGTGDDEGAGGVFKSTDAGATWGAASAGLPYPMLGYVFALAIDPSTSSTLYAGTSGGGVFKSTDAGASWGELNAGLTTADVFALAIDPITPSTLHAGTSSGVFSIQQVAGCIGDCDASDRVAINELIKLVNIALDKVELSACPHGVPGDVAVNIAFLVEAVNNTLNGCPAEAPEVLSGTLLVTDSGANKVHTLDAATGDILASADTEEHPNGVEKTNGKVYVANENSDTISVFESATLSPRTVIPVCHGPHHTAVSPDGSRVYAACVGTNKVAVVDAETDTLVGLLTSGAADARTHQPWPTKDGKRLWVANWESNDITEIDLQTDTILRVFPLDARPIEVVVPAKGKTAYASVPALGKMMVFDLETDQLVAEPTMLAPENLMLSGDGKTILTSWSGLHNPTAVSIFDTATLTAVDVALPGVLATHTDLTPQAKFGFVSLVGQPQGIVVVDIEAATVHAFYPIPGSVSIHAVRYAPGPP